MRIPCVFITAIASLKKLDYEQNRVLYPPAADTKTASCNSGWMRIVLRYFRFHHNLFVTGLHRSAFYNSAQACSLGNELSDCRSRKKSESLSRIDSSDVYISKNVVTDSL